ncbi:uncharacterized protein LOC126691306 [Quercus robur]|uniref:uncharacterized protein LOC126691306 n=1 Tax=Quercus robur TaxID=38942 RepID=UPI0021633165|nr:uncharacterized protein LOC126691306 [Quercus robur]
MELDIELYVKTCLVCQQDNGLTQKEAGLLQPLPIPESPWVSISMDFITGLPKVKGMGSFFVVVDRFSKYVVFMAAPSTCIAEVDVDLFYKNVVKYFGLLEDIPLTPHEIAKQHSGGTCPAAYRFSIKKQKLMQEAQDSLLKAQRRMKKYADKGRRPFESQVGDKRVGVMAYKLKLPKRLQIHPTIHMSFLKPYHGDAEDPTRNEARILDKKVTGYRKGGNMITYYLVKWKGAAESEASWEKASTLWQFEKEVKAFENILSTRTSASSGGGGLLGALRVADDGMRNWSAWTASS